MLGFLWPFFFFIVAELVNTSILPPRPFITRTELLWTPGVGEITAYRIPVITQCHDGSVVTFSEARKYESGDRGSKFIAFRKSKNAGQSWSTTRFLVDDWTHPDGLNLGAVVVDKEVKTLILLYSTCAHFQCTTRNMTARQFQIRSNDCGETWSKPIDLAKANHDLFNWTWTAGPGYGIQKTLKPHKGRLIVCGHTNVLPMGLYCIFSDDHGFTWKRGAKLLSIPYAGPLYQGSFAPTENQLVELKDGTLYFDARNEYKYRCHCRIYFNSTDGGYTIPIETLNFNSVAVDPTCDGSILLHNDVLYMSHANNDTQRVNTTLRWSMDYGKTWPYSMNVNPGDSGYSCLTRLSDNHIGLVYEKNIGPLWFVKIQLHL
ncbi:sialidase-1-like [Amphiura filiformis]|uniref:sialidase-1-like n=1 Tax=Amphiura filiformis TaxID=82378 RepID=UPI003B21F50A